MSTMDCLKTRLANAERSYDLAHFGGAGASAVADATRALVDAQANTETLDERAFRLGLKAAELDAAAERHMEAEADASGRAAGRRLKGNDDELAASFDREANACRAEARNCMAEAARLRSQASAIHRTRVNAKAIVAVAHAAE